MMAGESVEKALIKLTERGYNELYLKIIAHQRPIPVEEPKLIQIEDKKYYLLSFDCSHRQIRNYFFSFGAEAEVLEPESLRQWFINDYQSSIDVYEHNEENT